MNRAARNIRSGSSVNETSAGKGVRSLLAARSSTPLNGSTSCRSGSERAMALTVKSRLERSASMAVEKATSGLREPASYSSARWVVTSTRCPSLIAPMVPKRLPCVQMLSAQEDNSSSVTDGKASVVKSRSPVGVQLVQESIADDAADKVQPSSRVPRTVEPTRSPLEGRAATFPVPQLRA